MYNRHEYSRLYEYNAYVKCSIEKVYMNFVIEKLKLMVNIGIANLALTKTLKNTTTPQVEKISDYYKVYRDQNKEYFNKYCTTHYHTKKELYREWNRTKYHTDLGFKLKHITSARISQALKTYQILKKDRTIEYLGCTMDEYTQYLEQMFNPDMNWDNYGEYWEIDHIKPIDAFDLNDEAQLYEAFNYTNTQPLKKKDNREKSNKFSI
jgi:hypothetical protein